MRAMKSVGQGISSPDVGVVVGKYMLVQHVWSAEDGDCLPGVYVEIGIIITVNKGGQVHPFLISMSNVTILITVS